MTLTLGGALRCYYCTYYHLWYSIFVKDLPEVPVFSARGLPELECGDKGVFIGQPLRKHVSAEGTVQWLCFTGRVIA